MRRPVILLVQARDNGEMYAEFLRFHRCTVILCTDAISAEEAAPAADVIVTGLRLEKGTSGLDLMRQLRATPATAETPIIALTACATPGYELAAAVAGCDRFLAKPCLPDRLLREVRHQLVRRISPAAAKARATARAAMGAKGAAASAARRA